MIVVVAGDARLTGALVRELLARHLDVSSARAFEDVALTGEPVVAVVAEGAQDERDALQRAASLVTVRGGSLVYATTRADDDSAVINLKRRGVPYTIVRTTGLVDLPAETSTSLVLVSSNIRRAPFATIDDLARATADQVAAGCTGTGATVDVTMQAGARAWALALREAGARSYVVPRWLAVVASWFGVLRLEVTEQRVSFVSGMRRSVSVRALAAGGAT